jgi:hypothetical protein
MAKLRLTVTPQLLNTLKQLAQGRGLQTGRLCRQFIDEGIARAQRESLQGEVAMIDATKVSAVTNPPQSAPVPHDGGSHAAEEVTVHQAQGRDHGPPETAMPIDNTDGYGTMSEEELLRLGSAGDPLAQGEYVRRVMQRPLPPLPVVNREHQSSCPITSHSHAHIS